VRAKSASPSKRTTRREPGPLERRGETTQREVLFELGPDQRGVLSAAHDDELIGAKDPGDAIGVGDAGRSERESPHAGRSRSDVTQHLVREIAQDVELVVAAELQARAEPRPARDAEVMVA